MDLTPKQQRFVEEYLVDLNATQAAIRSGYSENGASVTGNRLLGNPKILGEINAAREVEREYTRITAAEVVNGLREQIALAGKAGQHSAAIRALELLGKHDGQFTDRTDVTSGGKPISAFVDWGGPAEDD